VGRNVELVQKYIKEHCQEKITLRQIAGILNISQGYLSSVFKKQTGKKFSDYVTEVKIVKAMELIETHQYTMYEISNMLAFDTQYYFSTVFKKDTGMTFLEYISKGRMDMAKRLLKETNRTVADICRTVGYSDVRYFSKTFAKYSGLKPNEYRKLYS